MMLECLLSLTRRRAKSQTSTGTHPLFLLLCYLFFFLFFFLFGYCLEFILNVLIDVSCDLQEAAAAGR